MAKKNIDSTSAVHGGEARPKPYGAIATPIVQSSTYTFQDTDQILDFMRSKAAEEPGLRHEYGRYSNPTQSVAEQKLAVLEVAEKALLFSSGMAAITTVLLTRLSAGDHMLLVSDTYHRTREFAQGYLARWGIDTTMVPVEEPSAWQSALRSNTRLIFGETPTNPYLRVMDLVELSRLAHERGITTIVDSTFATPINLRPLEFGIDLVVHSATKYLGGHNDLLAGVVIGSAMDLAGIEHARGVIGGVSNANEAYLLLRGLKTLSLRIERQNENGLRVAQYLEKHPKICRVYYPGLPNHPDHSIAARQMSGFGGVVSFEVDGDFELTGQLVDLLRLPYIGPTLGGVESIIQQPAAFYSLNKSERQSAGFKDNLLRYALGIEAVEDILSDLEQALDALS